MTDDLENHAPSEGARRRAAAAGYDLDRLKREDPDTYRMLCAIPVLRVDPRLGGLAAAPIARALAGQRVFEAETAAGKIVLAFPGPTRAELEHLDDLMGRAVEGVVESYGYYRVVKTRSGSTRELAFPTPPSAWQGGDSLVGPFPDERSAGAWGEENATGAGGTTYDVLNYAGGWFCDVFMIEDS